MSLSAPTAAQRLAHWVFWLWAPVPIVLVGLLMTGHLLTLPTPSLGRLQVPGTGWRALHVLALKCNCSRQVLSHLAERKAAPGFTEKVLLIGEDAALSRTLVAAGYSVEGIDSAELEARYGIRGAPLLVVVDPTDAVAYSGGYSRTARGAPEDSEIFAELSASHAVAALPLYGCAVSRQLQAQLDPLGLKYDPVTR